MDPSLSDDLTAAFSLAGRTAVVTGAGSGIGRETARTYAEAGARLVLADVSRERLDATAAEISGSTTVVTDVSQRASVDALAQAAIDTTGRLDVWANVAGVIRNTNIVDTTEDDLRAVLAVNLDGVFWGTAAAARVMSAAGRGAIVNVASAGGETPAPTLSLYGMSKAAVIQLTRVAAAELGPVGVRVNAVAPGFVETNMTNRVWKSPDGTVDEATRQQAIGAIATRSPLGVIGETRDIALAMLYLAVDASKFVTGQVVRPNGGVHMA